MRKSKSVAGCGLFRAWIFVVPRDCYEYAICFVAMRSDRSDCREIPDDLFKWWLEAGVTLVNEPPASRLKEASRCLLGSRP